MICCCSAWKLEKKKCTFTFILLKSRSDTKTPTRLQKQLSKLSVLKRFSIRNLSALIVKTLCSTSSNRNFIAQLAVISAEKLNLYNVWSSQDWEKIVNTDVRGKLLNDDFVISDSLHDEIGDGIVISFKDGAFMREVTKSDVTVIKFLKDDGINYLTKSVDDIITTLQNMQDIAGHLFTAQHTIPEIKVSEDASQLDDGQIVSDWQPAVDKIVQSSDKAEQEDYESQAAPAIAEKSKDGMKILFGHGVIDGKPIYWFPNDTEKVMHPNTGIIGTMGTGKTQLLSQLYSS